MKKDLFINENFQFSTDAATLAIFDLAAIQHRLQDDIDWWCGDFKDLREGTNCY